MKEYDEIVIEIEGIVNWWYKLQIGYTDLNNLDDVLRRLTALYYYFNEILSEQYKLYLLSYVARKVGHSKRVQGFIGQGKNVTLSKELALNESDLKEEIEQEAFYNLLKNKSKSIDKIIEAIKQKISNLKTEINRHDT